MADRIIVSLHLRAADMIAAGYLRRALAARKRAEALGGTLSAWGADSFAFDFGAEEVEEAVDLALATFDDVALAGPRFSAGVAYGEIERIGTGTSLALLAWGEPLLTATRLARSCEPGEVLIDERCPEHLARVLRTQGERRFDGDALTGLLLDTKHPFRRDTLIDGLGGGEDKVRVTVPPLPPISSVTMAAASRPAPSAPRSAVVLPAPPPVERRSEPPPATLRSDPPSSMEGSEFDLEQPSEPSPSSAAPATLTDPGVVAPPSEPTSEPPSGAPSEPPVPLPPLPSARSAPSILPPGSGQITGSSSDPPSPASWQAEEPDEVTSAAKQALLKGDVAEMERLTDELKTRGERGDLAERMAGFTAWNRGAKAEGLRKLRAAADAETRPAHRVRALLAYGVALAASGRTDAALLAGLGAIARAREVSDRQGEHVCARFLAKLSAAGGYERAALTWATVAEEAAAPRAP